MVYEDDVCTMYYFTELAMKKMNKFAFDIIAQDTNLMLIIEFHRHRENFWTFTGPEDR